MRNVYKILTGKREGMKPLEDLEVDGGNIKIDFKETVGEGVE
jgi:hypothetical protein